MTPRFVPFESMSDAEQREHLRRVHRVSAGAIERNDARTIHVAHHHRDVWPFVARLTTDHTHDKPAPRPEENR